MVRVDDILVATSGGAAAHTEVIKQVFYRLAKHIVRLNDPKCQFFQARAKYMGHILSKQGISPVNFFFKLDAIGSAPRPRDLSQLRSFAWMLNYYSKSINDFHPNCTHSINSVVRRSGFALKSVKQLLYRLKKCFRASRVWLIMIPKNLSY